MLVKVLKPFPYAHDNKFTTPLEKGQVVEIDDSVIEGLHAEGFIEEATQADIEGAQSGAVVIPAPVDIPDDWDKLHWFKLRPLAVALNGGQPVANKASAMAIIQAELDRRAAA